MEKRETHKQRIPQLDWIRALCTMGVMWCHFFSHTQNGVWWLSFFFNGWWGTVCVMMFFMLSGYSLYCAHPQLFWRGTGSSSMKRFFYKRWKAMFPMFYIAFAYFYFRNVLQQGTPFYSQRLYLTLLGMDGYLSFLGANYYILGEWFFGAILLLYAFYPFLLKALNRWPVQTSLLCAASLAILFYDAQFFGMTDHRSPPATLAAFAAGMLLAKYPQALKSKRMLAFSTVIALATMLIYMPENQFQLLIYLLLGFAMFVLCYHAGTLVMKPSCFSRAVQAFSRLSFGVYLVHHVIICELLEFHNPTSPAKAVVMFALTAVVVILAAKCLQIITNAVLGSALYTRAERWFLRKIRA